MPNLPTVNVTQAQADRILAVFGDIPTYRRWLATAVKEYVILKEAEKIDAEAYQAAVVAEDKKQKTLKDLDLSLTVPDL